MAGERVGTIDHLATSPDGHPTAGVAAVGKRFLVWMMLAHIGANLSFMPILAIIVPLRVVQLGGGDPSRAFTLMLLLGAGTASLATIAVGALSDRTRSPLGRRRPWMIGGIIALATAYYAIVVASSVAALIFAVVAFQLAVSVLYAPLMAIVPDRVPEAQRGRVSGVVALGNPLGSFVGAALVGALSGSVAVQLTAIWAITTALMLPLVIAYLDEPLPIMRPPDRQVARVDPGGADRLRVWTIRLLIVLALNLILGYMFFYLEALGDGPFTGAAAARGLAWLMAVAAVAQVVGALVAGWLSDRTAQRRGFALLSIVLIGTAAGLLLSGTGGALLVAVFLMLGIGHGVFQAMDLAMITQTLRSSDDSGRGMGVMNLANTLPQIGAPALAVWAGGGAAGFQALFAFAGIALALSLVPLATLRTVR